MGRGILPDEILSLIKNKRRNILRIRFQLIIFMVLRTILNTMHRMVYPFLAVFARGLGVDLTRVAGAGPKGRILHDDVRAFVKGYRAAGPTLTVLRTTVGSAQSVAIVLDRADWPDVVGTLSGDDTIFVATAGSSAQRRLLARLREKIAQQAEARNQQQTQQQQMQAALNNYNRAYSACLEGRGYTIK